MDTITFSRKQLYDLVWSESLLALSKKYNISDVGLRKICIRMSIPLPKAGHWNKVQAGKSVALEPLPSVHSVDEKITLSYRKDGEINNSRSSILILQKEIENDRNLPLTVPLKFTSPDKLILAARNALLKQNPSGYGNDKGLVRCYRGELNIKVSPMNVERALCFMDAFIKLLRARGHEIKVDDSTYVIIGNEKLEISLKERMKRKLIPSGISGWQNADLSPVGILSFRMKERAYKIKEWKDGRLPIEKQLSKIMAQIEIKAKELKEERLEREKYWAEERKKEQIRIELQKRKEKELSDFKGLLKEALRWRQVKVLREYIDEMEQGALANNNVSREFKNWLSWASKKVDWYDPFIEKRDNLLKDVDRSTLSFKKETTDFY